MRQKELRLVTTFHTTADALACERACKEQGFSGRIIPGPRQLSAGCGRAWSCEPGKEEEFAEFLKEHGVEFDEMATILF